MKNKYSIVFLILSLFFLFSCSLLRPKTDFCASLDEDEYSVICMASAKIGKTPEDIATLIDIANIGALAANAYTAEQANDYVDKLIATVNTYKGGSVNYNQLIQYAVTKYKALPPAVQAAFIVLDMRYELALDAPEIIKLPLSERDWGWIEARLTKQKLLIMPFLVAK